MKHNFLKSLDLPKSLQHQLPSIRFESGLADHDNLRGHELRDRNAPDYAYYATELSWVLNSSWRRHDGCLDLELCDPAAPDFPDEYYRHWSFGATEDYPARVLGSIAFLFGWRLVPYARWIAKKIGDQSVAHYVEQHCRQWAEDADVVFHLLEGRRINRENAMTQKALIMPIRQRANKLIALTLQNLGQN